MQYPQKNLSIAVGAALLATLSGCGGGSDNAGEDPGPEPVLVTLNGTVAVNQAIQNALVCMDLNANSACDAGEPASAKTGADGAYSLTYDTSKVTAAQAASASLIAAMVPGAPTEPGTTLDAAQPGQAATTSAYVLRQAPGKSGPINPLTTLVAAGIAAGMTESTARANVSIQLGIEAAKIDNYQDDETSTATPVADNARTMARTTALALERGATLEVADQMAAQTASPGDLVSLSYTDASNYGFRTSHTLAKPAGTAGTLYEDQRTRFTGGVNVDRLATLYPLIYLTSTGWKRCDSTTAHTGTLGNPSRSNYCNAALSVAFSLRQSIADQPMSGVLQAMQSAATSNTINNDAPNDSLLAAVGSAAFPAGAGTRLRAAMDINRPIFITNTNTDARPQSEATTLEQLIVAKPAAKVVLATAAGSLTLGVSTSSLRNLRVAFTGTTSPTSGTVQFYDCELNAAATVASNCAATDTGSYAIETVNGARVMRFAGHAPTPASPQENLYAEVKGTATGDYVFRARQSKPAQMLATSDANRLNNTAWAALKSTLGI